MWLLKNWDRDSRTHDNNGQAPLWSKFKDYLHNKMRSCGDFSIWSIIADIFSLPTGESEARKGTGIWYTENGQWTKTELGTKNLWFSFKLALLSIVTCKGSLSFKKIKMNPCNSERYLLERVEVFQMLHSGQAQQRKGFLRPNPVSEKAKDFSFHKLYLSFPR